MGRESTVIDSYRVSTLITQWTDFTNHNPITLRQNMFDNALPGVRHCQPIRLLIILSTTTSASLHYTNKQTHLSRDSPNPQIYLPANHTAPLN